MWFEKLTVLTASQSRRCSASGKRAARFPTRPAATWDWMERTRGSRSRWCGGGGVGGGGGGGGASASASAGSSVAIVFFFPIEVFLGCFFSLLFLSEASPADVAYCQRIEDKNKTERELERERTLRSRERVGEFCARASERDENDGREVTPRCSLFPLYDMHLECFFFHDSN